MSYLKELQDVIRRLHGVESEHVESIAVKETFQGTTVWEGKVEVFELYDHPETDKLYAWIHETDDPNNWNVRIGIILFSPDQKRTDLWHGVQR